MNNDWLIRHTGIAFQARFRSHATVKSSHCFRISRKAFKALRLLPNGVLIPPLLRPAVARCFVNVISIQGHFGKTKLDGVLFWLADDLGPDFSKGEFDWSVLFILINYLLKLSRDAIKTIVGHMYPVKWKSAQTAEGSLAISSDNQLDLDCDCWTNCEPIPSLTILSSIGDGRNSSGPFTMPITLRAT
jgi:hypothetical protein